MAKIIKDPIKIAKLIAKTKALSGGREVQVKKVASEGMPGSGKPAILKEVEITATPIKKMKDLKEQAISVAGFGNKSTPYNKRELVSALLESGLNKEADAVKALTSTIRGDLSDIVNRVIERKKIQSLK